MEEGYQAKLEAFLQTPQAYGHDASVSVARIETHISTVFLVADRAYKQKKPVDFGYLDFTTLEKRRAACIHELELNRRTAPGIYLKVIPVREVGDGFALGGSEGPIVEWLLEMVRFEQADVLSAKAVDGTLGIKMVEALARTVEGFHETAEIRTDAGGAERFTHILKSNEENFAPFTGSLYEPSTIDHLNAQASAMLETVGPLLNARRDAGWVRHCHGDLHLGNVALIDGVPVPFDCIEFNDDFARIDILYDLAFLLMDLSFRAKKDSSLSHFANAALNAYLQASPAENLHPHIEGLRAMPLFLSARAAVRSHVNARTWANTGNKADRESSRSLAIAYAHHAIELLQPGRPGLYAIGGLSGTGKSTVAKALAPFVPGTVGAIHLRTDVLRKTLAGVPMDERLPSSAYTQAASAAVYGELMRLAELALEAGISVVCDGVFAKPVERAGIEAIADKLGVPFRGLWLTAPQAALEARVDLRSRTERDASDATVEVLHQQLSYALGDINWAHVESEGTREAVLDGCLHALNLTSP